MNPKVRKLKHNPCVVCGYKYSDRHHMYPKAEGGKDTITLCPNHHRYANIIQIIIKNNGLLGDKRAREFATKNFDEQFNAAILERLIIGYYQSSLSEYEWE